MEENKHLVSIIVRTKDRPILLTRTIRSIASQEYRKIEVILVNDGGCEIDIEGFKSVLNDISLNYIKLQDNTGRSHAANIGIENAKGSFIGFLDDDDEYYTNHISTLVKSLVENSNYKIAYTDSFLAFHEFKEIDQEWSLKKKVRFYSEDFSRDRFLFENYIPFMCLLFDRKMLMQFSFDEDLHAQEDWRLLTLISRDYEFLHIKNVTCQYNIYAESFVSYLESRYDIQKYASVVFEKNKEYITWNAWMNFKNRFENLIKDAGAMNEYLKRESIIYKDKDIEEVYNFLVRRFENIIDSQNTILNRIDTLSDINIVTNNKIDNLVNAYVSLKSDLGSDLSGKIEDIINTQNTIISRLSISGRIKNLIQKFRNVGRKNR